MAMQYTNNEAYSLPEIEYRAELLRKKLLYSMANFAQVKFHWAMRARMLSDEQE